MFPLRLSRRARRRALVLAPAAAALAYFAYHAVDGEVGYTAWVRLQAEATRLEEELDRVRRENAALEAAIAGLRPESVDPDAVETALRDLGYVGPHEVVVLTPAD